MSNETRDGANSWVESGENKTENPTKHAVGLPNGTDAWAVWRGDEGGQDPGRKPPAWLPPGSHSVPLCTSDLPILSRSGPRLRAASARRSPERGPLASPPAAGLVRSTNRAAVNCLLRLALLVGRGAQHASPNLTNGIQCRPPGPSSRRSLRHVPPVRSKGSLVSGVWCKGALGTVQHVFPFSWIHPPTSLPSSLPGSHLS